MKSRVFFMIIALPLAAVLLPPAVIALDDPHKNGITCTLCHQNPSSTWWTDQGATDGLCGQCHYPSSPNGDAMIHAISSTYGSIVMPCTQCHNPHYQKQLRAWKTAGYLTTGTISAVTTTTLTRAGTAPGWSPDQWKGMLLVPDVRYLQHNYRIESNTASVITIDTSRGDAIKLAYAAPGASFAIGYGGLVKEAIGGYSVRFLRETGVNSFADGDAARDGVCEVCHTRTTHFRASGSAPDQLHTSIGSSAAGTRCIACHKHTAGFVGTNAGCLGCHDGPVGSRAAVGSRFQANSHHVQGVEVTNQHCYQCHWEANDDGTINTSYHSGSSVPGSVVDLVIYGAAARPTSYTEGTTAIQYLANGSRAEINKLTTHCLGCHSDQNSAAQPFGDGKTPKQYAWDGSSVANRYSQAGVVPWGKYTGARITPKNTVTKAYSAHGNAVGSQGGWNLAETWPNTRNGSVNVQCFDCHNSHGSAIVGRTSSYTSATVSGGILKETSAGQGGYSVTYVPEAGGSVGTKDHRNAGASLCFDCHQTQMEGTTTPWGYGSTFGASQEVLGYRDSSYFGPGTFGYQQRYSYKRALNHKGGHFGASSPVPGATGTIDGLCTPCHDPHGVTNNTAKIAVADKPYAVPLLKGTWMTSPYKEDVAPANNTTSTINDANAGDAYHIDQNTFGTDIMVPVTGITQTDTQFAGLCLTCHPKNSLTDGVAGGTWKSVDRVHESVKGWGANTKHKYTCSKCHTPHNSSLPRLMATNCLNTRHKGRVGGTGSPILSGSAYNCGLWEGSGGSGCGGGEGWFPGTQGGGDGYYYPTSNPTYIVSCHENQSPDQSWNSQTPWSNMPPGVPTLIDEPDTASTSIQLQWNASTDPEGDAIQYLVQIDNVSNFSSPDYTSPWMPGTSYSLTVGNNTIWYWRVKARDATTESEWANDSFMVSDGNAPPQVTLSNPANGTLYNYYPTYVFLQWSAVLPLAEYRVEVDNEPGFSSPLVFDSGWITNTYASALVSTAGTHYWRVQARDPYSLATGMVSETRNFITNRPPAAPLLINEPDTTSINIELQWNAATDPEGGAIQYMVEVDDASNFTSPDYTSGWITGTSYSLTVGTNATWYWHVKARDPLSESGWSAYDPFVVSDGIAPPQVTLSSPASGTVYYGHPVNVTFQWNTVPPFAQYRLEVDNESGFSAPLVHDSGWTTATSRAVNITSAGTYYWRVQARDTVSGEAGPVSNAWTIILNGPPTVPVLMDEPHTTSTNITLDWNASTDPEGDTPLQYYAVVDDDPNFGSPNFGGVWQSGTSLSFTVGMNTTWYWRVKARDSLSLETAWSSIDIFAVADGTPPPAPTLSSPADGWAGWTACSTWSYGMTFSYYSEPATEYRVLVDDDPAFGSLNYDSGWSANPSWYADVGVATWYWKVGARDPVNPGTESWSGNRSFTIYYGGDCSASCPVLYVWDGTKYAFETDLFSRGILSRKEAGVYIRPNPNDYYLLANAPAGKNGTYELKIVEERSEIDYLDQMKLYTVDYPENRNVYAEPNRKGDPAYISPAQALHTVDKTERHPLSAIHLRTGADVAAKIADIDGNYLVFGEDREYPSWETVEMDLGDLSTAPMIKFMINGAQAFPTTPEGASRVISIAGSNFYKLEVPDGVGGWVEKQGQLNMGNLGEFARTMIIDISDIFLAHLYRIRFSYATKSYIDSMTFDTTPDEPLVITELPLAGADLAYGGFNAKVSVFEDVTVHVYGDKIDKPFALLPGNYTRFGDITPLLPSVDDKFVIMGQAEELTLRFTVPAPAAVGNRRQLLFYGDGFYKAYKYANTRSVDPLPFAAMSNFPYDELFEHYPDDAEHQQYQLEYNTRVQ